ncbi:MAG: tetratricopeptide repeat protein [Rhodospirillales bacterium]
MAQRPDPAPLLTLAAAKLREGRAEEAEALCRKAIAAAPKSPDAYVAAARVAAARGFANHAADRFRKALALQPDHALALDGLGSLQLDQGRADEAAATFARLAAAIPLRVEGHYNLGTALMEGGRLDEAIAAFRRALAIDPAYVDAHVNLGNALRRRERFGEAVAAFAAAVALAPGDLEALGNHAAALYETADAARAIAIYRRILVQAPADAATWTNLGTALHFAGTLEDALSAFDRALAADPRLAEAHCGRAEVLRDMGRADDAATAIEAALALDPDNGDALAAHVQALANACDWDALAAAQARLAALTDRAIAGEAGPAETPFLSMILTDDPARNLAVAQRHSARIARRAEALGITFAHPPRDRRGERLRIGYLSHDFRSHAVAHLTAGMFERHDRGRFMVHAYSVGPDDGSAWRRRISDAVDVFAELRTASVAELARRIHGDGIDILVDLTGHTKGSRLGALALRPAPVQAWYLGYPGTSGAAFMDYVIADAIVAPLADAQHYAERLVHLPHCFQATDDRQPVADRRFSRAELGLPDGAPVFCSFNQAYKVEPVMFAAWMRILARCPGAALWLLGDPAGRLAANLRRATAAHGIDPARLVFAPPAPLEAHLARLAAADLMLDARVYNGGTTTSQTLWAGVPVLTLAGNRFASRMSASILAAAGLPDLVTDSLDAFEARAVALAHDPAALAAVRARLAANRSATPLFDTARFTRGLERAFEAMWARHAAGLAPDHVVVGDD